MIDAHIIDARGAYLRTDTLDVMQAQPPGAVYAALPEPAAGHTRMWQGGEWVQVPDADVPAMPEPATAGPPVPLSVTPAQGLVALFALQGITETALQAAIDQIADPVQQYTARIGVTRTTEWRRDSVTTQAMASLMGLSEADLDALFVYAAGVQV